MKKIEKRVLDFGDGMFLGRFLGNYCRDEVPNSFLSVLLSPNLITENNFSK